MRPRYEDFEGVPSQLSTVVTSEMIDANGHVGVPQYLHHAGRGLEIYLAGCGVDADYRASRGLTVVTVEHHLSYWHEMHLGHRFSAHAMWLDRSERTGHVIAFLVNHTVRQPAFALEGLLVHMDLTSRRATPYPEDLAITIDREIAQAQSQSWPIAAGGAVSVRR